MKGKAIGRISGKGLPSKGEKRKKKDGMLELIYPGSQKTTEDEGKTKGVPLLGLNRRGEETDKRIEWSYKRKIGARKEGQKEIFQLNGVFPQRFKKTGPVSREGVKKEREGKRWGDKQPSRGQQRMVILGSRSGNMKGRSKGTRKEGKHARETEKIRNGEKGKRGTRPWGKDDKGRGFFA